MQHEKHCRKHLRQLQQVRGFLRQSASLVGVAHRVSAELMASTPKFLANILGIFLLGPFLAALGAQSVYVNGCAASSGDGSAASPYRTLASAASPANAGKT